MDTITRTGLIAIAFGAFASASVHADETTPPPAPTPVSAPAPAPTPPPAAAPATMPPAPAEGRRITGVDLTPGVVDIAKKEGEVKLTKDDRVKCEKYMPLGSHRVKFRCTTVTEERQAREDNNREMRKIQTPPPSAGARTIGT